VQVGVEEAIFVKHANDSRRPEIDHPLSLFLTQFEDRLRVRPNAAQVFHCENVSGAKLPIHVRKYDARYILEVGRKNLRVVRFVVEVDLPFCVRAELLDNLLRLISGKQPLQDPPEELKELQIGRYDVPNAWFDHLQHHVFPIVRSGAVDLCDGGGPQGIGIDGLKECVGGIDQLPLDDGLDLLERNGRQVIHQAVELLRNHFRQEILSDGHNLAQFCKRGAEDFQPPTKLRRKRKIPEVAPDERR